MQFIEFVRALFGGTVSRLSGGIGVALGMATTFAPSTWDAAKPFTLGATVIAFVITCYGAWAVERRRANSLAAQVATQGKLDIKFVHGVRGYDEERRSVYDTVSRTVSVAVINVGGRAVSGCKLWAVSVEPNEGGLPPDVQMFSMPGNTLNPGDRVYVPIATFIEPKADSSGDTMGLLHIPFKAGGKPGVANDRTFGADTVYTLTLRATGDGSAPCHSRFRLRVGDGKLRLEALGPAPGTSN